MSARDVITARILDALAVKLADEIHDHDLTEREVRNICADLHREATVRFLQDRAELKAWRNKEHLA